MRNEINLQDRMLSALRQQAQNITVFLTNGFQMRGIVRGFDSFVVILESDGKQQMIYKHAISTLIPQHRVDLHAPRGDRAEQCTYTRCLHGPTDKKHKIQAAKTAE